MLGNRITHYLEGGRWSRKDSGWEAGSGSREGNAPYSAMIAPTRHGKVAVIATETRAPEIIAVACVTRIESRWLHGNRIVTPL